jgi:serine/threonine protein kinase
MLYGTVPFKGTNMDELHSLIKNGQYSLKDDVSKEARKLIKSILETDPRKRLKLREILETPWMQDVTDHIDIFTENEKETIKKELIYANTRRINRNFGKEVQKDFMQMTDNSDIFPFFTEHKLDSTQNSLVRNRTTKSVILAPFNSTLTHISDDYEEPPILKKNKVIKFGVKVKDIDRQYEANNN